MSGHLTFAGWFVWSYIGVFVLLTLLAAWWVADLVRRPVERFPEGWPAPKLRWGAVPAAWLLVIGIQTVLWAAGFVVKGAARLLPAASIGLITSGLLILMVVVGIAYLLRVVFAVPGRGESDDVGPDDEAPEDLAKDQ